MEVPGLNVAPLSWVQLVTKPLSWLTHYSEDKKQLCDPLGPQVVAYKMTVTEQEGGRKAPDWLFNHWTPAGRHLGVGLACFEGTLVWQGLDLCERSLRG